MKACLSYLIKSIMAGIMIGIGGTIFLSLENKIIGSIFFAIGLFMIVTRSLNLFTGKVGYIVNNKPKYLIEVLITLIGNFIGTYFVAFLLKFTRIYTSIQKSVNPIIITKLNDSLISIFILSIFCGILMYLAVDGYKVGKDIFQKYASVFLGVIVFILCGFEHSIANMYYFSVYSHWSIKIFYYLLVMILGNSVGGIFIPTLDKIKHYLELRQVKI